MQSRFMKGSVNPTILCLASSKRTEQSYMETFIESKKNNESKTTKVVDEPQWVIREDKNSDVKFKVALGNKFLSSEVIPLDATESDVQLFIDRGFTILEVPIGYYENFIDDIDIALTDIAGISTTSSSRYIAGHRISAIKDSTIKNPFVSDVLEIGDGKDDTNQYYDFFNMELVDKSLLQYPMYVHLDMSVSGDKTGLGGVWIVGKKPPVEGQPPSKELFYRLAFMVSIKAPKGHQISFEKNRQFIYWLKENGFNIKGVSCDTYQSADLLQQLKGKGFDTEIISVDRVKDNICPPYQYLKSTIYEERLVIFEDNLLVEELLGLERNNSNGKVDHAPTGINCFTGDTEVSLVDGRTLSFIELVDEFNQGKRNFVYSFNIEKQRIEPKLITNAWCSGHNAKLVEVTLDNGEVLRCTPEHKFMLKDGTYKQAINLVSNDSLMPLYTRVSDKGLKGYRMYFEPIEGKWHYEHRMFANNVLDEKYLVHHQDCNPLNNSPDNLLYHRVKSVCVLDTREDVFDITVEDNHNFALKAGVFVHNSKDSADALCGAIWNASQHGEEFDFEFGETLDTIVDVSLETSEKNYKTQVTIDFEDELKKVSNSFSESLKNDKSVYTDFGLGASTTDYSMYDCLII